MINCGFIIYWPTIMNERTKQLRQIMADHKKSDKDVGELLERTPMTVKIWRCASDGRTIPKHSLELLKAKLGAAL